MTCLGETRAASSFEPERHKRSKMVEIPVRNPQIKTKKAEKLKRRKLNALVISMVLAAPVLLIPTQLFPSMGQVFLRHLCVSGVPNADSRGLQDMERGKPDILVPSKQAQDESTLVT